MQQHYNKMMEWALGKDFASQNVKMAPAIWRTRHPDLPQLREMRDKPAGANAYYYIFQMTAAWMAAHEINGSEFLPKKPEQQQEESQPNESISAVFRIMWDDFVSMFKPKRRTKK